MNNCEISNLFYRTDFAFMRWIFDALECAIENCKSHSEYIEWKEIDNINKENICNTISDGAGVYCVSSLKYLVR
jgi:hypothetical protein